MKSTKPRIIKAVSILLALLSVIGATVPRMRGTLTPRPREGCTRCR